MIICTCENPPFFYGNYKISELGIDITNGRYADVIIETCIHCNKKWIKYSVQYEGFPKSGRWFKALISEYEIKLITPENAVSYLEKSDSFFYGGSFFETDGRLGKGKIEVDLF